MNKQKGKKTWSFFKIVFLLKKHNPMNISFA